VRRQLERYGKWLLAIAFLAIVAVVCGAYILVQQRLPVPFQDRYALQVELAAASGLTPGLGQPVNVAGVKVGQVDDVRLREGRALVRLQIQADELPQVFSDARVDLVPRTPLKDLQVELDPGRRRDRPLPPGATIPIERTSPPVDSDELTRALDADTREFLTMFLVEGERGLRGRGMDLRGVLRSLRPTAEQLARVTTALKARRGALRGLVHELSILAEAAGSRDAELQRLVTDGNATLGALAAEERALRGSVRALPATLAESREALVRVEAFTERLAPALERLRPGARALPGALQALAPAARTGTTVLRTQLRPFVREAQPLVRDLRPTVRDLTTVTPSLQQAFTVLNYVANELTYNPPGKDQEGYLHWLAWFSHNAASFLSTQDANGPVWRGLVLSSCSTLGGQPGLTELASVIFAALPACER
jgi:phospholipid/cholesterol/gamma-HCH transport system substrate-binding protein